MKKKIVLAITGVILLVSAIGLIWKVIDVVSRKKAPAKKVIVAAPIVKKKPVPAPVIKKFKNPKVAIVIDDFGYHMTNIEGLFAIKEPLTFSILPGLRYSRKVAEAARLHGYEAILHLPLESHRKDVKEETDTIRSGMSDKEIEERLAKEIESVPGLKGVSNHMGSKSTEDAKLMAVIFGYLKKHNLYFFDSLTSEKSVCRETAAETGLRYARRNIFLDNSSGVEDIEKELAGLEKFAFKKGYAIAICHDRKNTVAALSKVIPKMAKDGVRFVYLSDMVK